MRVWGGQYHPWLHPLICKHEAMLALTVGTVIITSISTTCSNASMLRKDFKNLLQNLPALTRSQRQKLLQEIIVKPATESIEIIESHNRNSKKCPHCQSPSFNRWGAFHGLQRFRCKDCKRTFNSLTGSSLTRLRHKEQWLTYAQCMTEGKTLRQAANQCGIDLKTSFRWRHRFLTNPAADKSEKMTGIVEADEAFFTQSSKGSRQIKDRLSRKRGQSAKKLLGERVPVLIVRDRSGTEADFVFEKIEKDVMHACLKSIMGSEIVLCSDGNSIYHTFAKKENIPHKRIVRLDGAYVVEDIFHIQNVNAYISRLRKWLVRFNGVATRYLENYLGWRRLLENRREEPSAAMFLRRALNANHQQLMPT
jgi:transposase-like protein